MDVAEGYAGDEGGGDEGVTQNVGSDSFGDPGPSGGSADDPPGGVTVQAEAVRAAEDGAVHPLADGEVDGPGGAWRQRKRDDLAALAGHGERAMATFETECFDVGAEGLGSATR